MIVRIPAKHFEDRGADFAEIYKIFDALITHIPVFICGGSVSRCIFGRPQSDYDIFFKSESDLLTARSVLTSTTLGHVTADGSFNITMQIKLDGKEYKVQLIKLYHPNIESILESFDFTICQFGIENKNEIAVNPMSLYDQMKKTIVVNKITYAYSSMRRMLKYAAQGYHLCEGAATTLLQEVANDPSIIRSDVKYID